MPPKNTESIALVTPWPPQKSGIADYASSLAKGMRDAGCRVDVFTNACKTEGVHYIESSDQVLGELERYRRVLFQIGNHPFFHGYMIPLLADLGREKCVVEMHDLRLSHILPGINYYGDSNFEARWLSSNYGGFVKKVDDAHPVSDLLCGLASDVVVHSNFVKTRLRQLGVERIHVLDLAYDLTELQPRAAPSATAPIRVGVFGTFQRNRQITLIVDALALLARHGVCNWTLVLGGRRTEEFREIEDAIRISGISHLVELHEDIEQKEFVDLIKSVDVHVALRNPTYGETSGVVVQALASGIPTIVSQVGWYSELPVFVKKIPADGALFELTKALHIYISDVEHRSEIARQTLQFASKAYDIKLRAEEILSILNS